MTNQESVKETNAWVVIGKHVSCAQLREGHTNSFRAHNVLICQEATEQEQKKNGMKWRRRESENNTNNACVVRTWVKLKMEKKIECH